jgi:mRNA interferase RelE/StbE
VYRITYHHRIPDDIASLSAPDRAAIQRAIETKLTASPELFGKPLRFSLKGLRSMRVGDYRVVFRIQKNEVFIVLIAHRSFVYKEADKRR